MYFQFACEHCGKSLRAREEHVGRKVVCPYCHTQVAIERQAKQAQEQAPTDPLKNLKTSVSTPAPRKTPATTGTTQPSTSEAKWVDGTNVSMIKSCLFGLAGTAAFLVVISPFYFAKTYFGKLFFKFKTADGNFDPSFWVPIATTFLLAWAIAIIVLKSRKLKRQRQSMLFDLLPNQFGDDINEGNLEKFIEHVGGLPGDARESFLVNRVKRGLEHFRVRKNASEVSEVLSSQSDIDANAVESSYSILNVFIWAIPILGFIGTVIGISAAVGGFSGTLDSGNDVDALKNSLKGVTGGLGTAFDTTLVALVMSMMVMFPTSSMKKAEEDLLNWVDEYCNENLLKRLSDGRDRASTVAASSTPADVQRAVNAAMATHQAALQAWTQKLEAIGKVVTKEVADGMKEVAQTEKSLHQEKVNRLNEVGDMTGSMRSAAESLADYCSNLQTGLTSLNEVLVRLGEQQVVVQQVEKPRRKGLFGRRNGM
jgi:biopolymer transport protein ExbB/TolQ/DNA-directed RNA polymerase subunit RPC12/RpoP